MQNELVFAGFGGQGVMFAGQLLAYAAMDEGLEVTWIPSYGPEMRGGTAHCFVVISEKSIGSPLTRHPKAAVVFNNPSFIKYESEVAPGGLLAANSSLIVSTSARTDIRLLHVPATQIADELGAARLTNVVMLGAVLTALPVVPLEAVRRALENHMLKHRPERLPLNEEALRRGAAYVSDIWKREH